MTVRFAALLLFGALSLSGCGGRTYVETPVTPLPTSAEEEEKLRASLVEGGAWHVDKTVYADGSEEKESVATQQFFDFQPDGVLDWRLNNKTGKYAWKVEGKNLTTTHPGFPAFRVDSINPKEMRAFWYSISATLVFNR